MVTNRDRTLPLVAVDAVPAGCPPRLPTTTPHTTMHDLTGFQRDLLYVVARLGDPKGVEIKDELEQYYDATIDRGRLYPNLDTLVEEGLVDKERTDYRTNVYTLTPRGRNELEARRDWKDRYLDG